MEVIRRRGHLGRIAQGGLAVMLAASPGVVGGQEGGSPPDEGERLFDSYCSACHQYDEQGMGEAPPLDDSPWVNGPAGRLVRIILHGVEGRIEIRGRTYDREMPGFGTVLSDHEIAALVTYTRQRFGVRSPEVTAAEVTRIRAETAGRDGYWSADELLDTIR